MKKLFNCILFSAALFHLAACNDDSDLAIKRVASPVVIETEDTSATEVTAVVTELDKSGILDNSIGIVSTPVPDLSLEVFASGISIGTFTTDVEGKIVVVYADNKPNEFAGTYKGVAFRIKK